MRNIRLSNSFSNLEPNLVGNFSRQIHFFADIAYTSVMYKARERDGI